MWALPGYYTSQNALCLINDAKQSIIVFTYQGLIGDRRRDLEQDETLGHSVTPLEILIFP